MAQIAHVLARLKRDPIADLPLAAPLEQMLQDLGHVWRERLLTPLVTLRLFLVQILNCNVSIAALRQLSGIHFAPSSYSEARDRLPLELLNRLLRWLHEQAGQSLDSARKIGARIFIVDGSTYSVEDTESLRKHFHLPAGTKPGVGYPMGKLMGLLDAATGMFVSLLALPLFEHDIRSVISLHPMLRAGDILLGDRAFCSFCHLALLNARGVLACVRLHQRRKVKGGGVDRWHKPAMMPQWMDPASFASLPRFIDVRIVRYEVVHKGYRTRHVLVATTMMDEVMWPQEKIAELYGQRWQIETCFDHLKTTMGMNALRCKTADGVRKELAVYLLVYNLVRLAMLKAARRQGVSVKRISFIDALRWLAARMVGLTGVPTLIVNPDRTGRCQLRVIRRRYKQYDLLRKSRRETEAEIAAKAGKYA
ncbi:MAG: IS4 family transposase [Candidatus Acidiferrales bacterium]